MSAEDQECGAAKIVNEPATIDRHNVLSHSGTVAISIRVRGARASTPRCGSGCRCGRRCWTPATSITACCGPSSCTVATIRAVRCSDRREAAARPRTFSAMPTSTFQRPSRRCANTGCRSATHAPADHCGRGSSYRLRWNCCYRTLSCNS